MNLARRLRLALAAILGRYEGATFSPSRSLIPGTIQAARFDACSSARSELVRRSRYFERNSATVNRLADLFETYTVGNGLQVSPRSSSQEWNLAARNFWEEWGKTPDASSWQTFGQLQALAARAWFVDGESFIILTRDAQGTWPRVQLIESHLVATPPELAEFEGRTVIDGVAVNPAGRPIGFHIATEGEKGKKTFGPSKPASFVVQVFEASRPGQYRGLPFLYPVINDLHDLDDLQQLEMKAAKDAAEVTNVVKNAAGELSDEETLRAAGEVQNQNLAGDAVVETRAEYVRSTIGGRTIALRLGEEFEQFRNERPTAASSDYWRHLTEKVCTGAGIPYVLAYPDSMQGTVYRGALDMANAFFRARSLTMAEAVRRVYEYVLGWGKDNVKELRNAPADWNRVAIHPPRSVNVDVGRNSQAMLRELEAGTRTFADVYGELGQDFREKLEEKALEAKLIRDLADRHGLRVAEISTLQEDRAERVRTEPQEPTPAPEEDPDDPALAPVPARRQWTTPAPTPRE